MIALRLLLMSCLMLGALRASVAQAVRVDALEDRAELIQLFDGKSLEGWRGSAAHWTASNDELVGSAKQPLPAPQYLITERQFSDFRLLGQVRLVAGREIKLSFGGACSITDEQPSGCDARVITLKADALAASKDEWAQFELIVVGQRARFALNGRDVSAAIEVAAAPIRSGPLVFELGKSDETQEVRLRQLMLETQPGLTFQTVSNDVPPRISIRALERTVDPTNPQIDHWTKLSEALVPDELLQPARGTRLPLTSFGVRDVERDAYYALAQKARELPLNTLHRAADEWRAARRTLPEHRRYVRLSDDKFPLFADLFRSPVAYHGKLVTLRGHVRRLDEMPADENPYGIEKLYQVWLFDEHSQSNPTVIVCTSIDARLKPESETLINHCRATGYFFKNMAYDGQRDLRFAPLLIAQKLEYSPPEDAGSSMLDALMMSLTRATGLSRESLTVIGLIGLCGLSLLVVLRLQRRPARTKAVATPAVSPSFQNVTDSNRGVSFNCLPQAEAASEPIKDSGENPSPPSTAPSHD